MRVRCVTLAGRPSVPRHAKEAGQALTVGTEYIVVAISAPPTGSPEFALVDDSERVSMWPAQMFEATAGDIPSNWAVDADEDGVMIAPRAWLRRNFWHDLYGDLGSPADAQLEAGRIWRRELDVIIREARSDAHGQ